MREYTRIAPQFWTGETGRVLRKHPDAQRLALYLVSCPSANMIGLYYVADPTICHEVGLEPAKLPALWALLSNLGFAHRDADLEMVWIPNMARIQLGDALKRGDKRSVGVARQLENVKRHRFARQFWDLYAAAFCLDSVADGYSLATWFDTAPKESNAHPGTPSKGLVGVGETPPKQDQDQEQDHAQAKDPHPSSLLALPVPDRASTRSEERAGFYAPRESSGLLRLFGKLWSDRYGRDWLGRPQAARLATTFMDRPPAELDVLAPLLEPAIRNFLADERAHYLERSHAFELFAKDFDAHTGPPVRARAGGGRRSDLAQQNLDVAAQLLAAEAGR